MLEDLDKLPRSAKILLLILVDTISGWVSIYLSVSLRLAEFPIINYDYEITPFIILLPLLIWIVGFFIGVHKVVAKNFDTSQLPKLFQFSIMIGGAFAIINFFAAQGAPRSVVLIFIIIFFLICLFSRWSIFKIFELNKKISFPNEKNIIIFGAGEAGRKLFLTLSKEPGLYVLGFIDDNKNLQGTSLFNLTVYSRNEFSKKFKQLKPDEFFVAIPSANNQIRKNIIEFLSSFEKKVSILPGLYELLVESDLSRKMISVSPNEYLGRPKINIDSKNYMSEYKNKTVLVTGSGGSIGSEICMQLIKLSPSKIVLFELNEFALYKIQKKIELELENLETIVIPCLGDINDELRVSKILKDYKVNVIIHAAAYKHVPLIEENVLAAVKNNIFGTKVLIDQAEKCKVKKFILISSDKAVRPTNVMGGTKRISEMIVQKYSKKNVLPSCAIVRFGNVLGSSGSVIPLFENQIRAGGPVTVTHKEMTRYFMAIQEASQLVLLAGAYKNEGDVYVLDMGKPIKIVFLAEQMIKISGLTVRNENNPNGDIEINYTGKRPGEKLFEELLIDDKKMEKTNHPKIMSAKENYIGDNELNILLNNIKKLFEEDKEFKLKKYILKSTS